MVSSSKKSYDVFISHSAKDAALADEIANACRAGGLEAFTDIELATGTDTGEALWEALAESRALLTILPPSGPTPSMAIEIGAARAWNKPIFAVVTEPSSTRIPPALSGIRLYTTGRLQDVIEAAKSSAQQLSEEDRTTLAGLYPDIGVSVDQLALDPRALEGLVRRFEKARGKAVPGERLLSELLRLRKQGALAVGHPTRRARSRQEPA